MHRSNPARPPSSFPTSRLVTNVTPYSVRFIVLYPGEHPFPSPPSSGDAERHPGAAAAAVDPHGSTAGMVLFSLTLIPPLVYVNATRHCWPKPAIQLQIAHSPGNRKTHPAYCGALPADLSCIRKIQLLPPARSDPLQQARPRYLSLGPLTCGSDPLLPSRRKSNPWYVALKKRCPPLRCAGATCPSQICRCKK